MTTVIAGIGNIFLGDDAFGCEVARRLMPEAFPEGVRVVDFGIRSWDLAFAMLEADRVILIDAVPRGGPAGTLYRIKPDCAGVPPDVEGHGLNPMTVFALVRAMGGELPDVVIVGCEPEDCEERMGLSERVAASVDPAAEMVRELIVEEQHGTNNSQGRSTGAGRLRSDRQPA
jgi:hydrogenase maturation protease